MEELRSIIFMANDAVIPQKLRNLIRERFDTKYTIEKVRSLSAMLSKVEELRSSNVDVPIVICPIQYFKMDEIGFIAKMNKYYPEVMKIVVTEQGVGFEVANDHDLNGLHDNGKSPNRSKNFQYLINMALEKYENVKKILLQKKQLIAIQQEADKEKQQRIILEKELSLLKHELESSEVDMFNILDSDNGFQDLIGESEAMQYVLYRIQKVAPISTTVLILGETGTGKELIAQAIHKTSPRSKQPLVKVNCAALPSELIESELFGHEKGTFTGANSQKMGKFEYANGGTLFLDEIGELPINLQPKILRAIESNEIERLGGNKSIKIDVRIIAATNRDLESEIKKGNFRKDLFYRLNIYPVTLPPLRQRKDDIEMLLDHFIKKFNKKIGRNVKGIAPKAYEKLMSYDWPGNIRELENIIERAVILSHGNKLDVELPNRSDLLSIKGLTLADAEKNAILEALIRSNGKISGNQSAALYLNVNPSTLRAKMRKLGIAKQTSTFLE